MILASHRNACCYFAIPYSNTSTPTSYSPTYKRNSINYIHTLNATFNHLQRQPLPSACLLCKQLTFPLHTFSLCLLNLCHLNPLLAHSLNATLFLRSRQSICLHFTHISSAYLDVHRSLLNAPSPTQESFGFSHYRQSLAIVPPQRAFTLTFPPQFKYQEQKVAHRSALSLHPQLFFCFPPSYQHVPNQKPC